jgi:hypothetical protein
MNTDTSMIRTKVIEEIYLLPNERLNDLYNLIHYFRLGVEHSAPLRPPTYEKIMALAGSWQDLSELEFTEFLTEINQRRQLAFQRRRSDESNID